MHSTAPPGAFLAEELAARKIRPRDIDAGAGWCRGTTKRLIKGAVRVDQSIADGLAIALGTPASTWLVLQRQWDDRPPPDVMAVHNWASNAHMLADLFRIMAPPDGRWCDLTHGTGRWWKSSVNPAPDGMVRCVGPGTANPAPHDVVTDFRATPFADDAFAVTAYDPPYVLKGSDAQFATMAASYGIDDAHGITLDQIVDVNLAKRVKRGIITDGTTSGRGGA